jgi:hypothetical protein
LDRACGARGRSGGGRRGGGGGGEERRAGGEHLSLDPGLDDVQREDAGPRDDAGETAAEEDFGGLTPSFAAWCWGSLGGTVADLTCHGPGGDFVRQEIEAVADAVAESGYGAAEVEPADAFGA